MPIKRNLKNARGKHDPEGVLFCVMESLYRNLKLVSSPSVIFISGHYRKRAVFECVCGNKKEYDYYRIITKGGSCRKCAQKKAKIERIKHGLIKHPLYSKWSDMKKRCYNLKVDRYNSYGALGIVVCDEWKNDFINFYNWSINNGWEEGLTIERKDVYKNYCPENCCYITMSEQKFNLKNTFYIYYKDIKIPLKKLISLYDIKTNFHTLFAGIKYHGKNIEYYIKKDTSLEVAILKFLNL